MNTPTLALEYVDNPDKRVRVQACNALGVLKDKSTSHSLVTLLQTEEDPQVRQSAVKSLGLLGASEALPLLQSVSNFIFTLHLIIH